VSEKKLLEAAGTGAVLGMNWFDMCLMKIFEKKENFEKKEFFEKWRKMV
jgi:hypothetical protein